MNTFTFSQNFNYFNQSTVLTKWFSSKQFKNTMFLILLLAVCFAFMAVASATGTTGITQTSGADDFKVLLDKLMAWSGGALGKSLALLAFIVGLFYGAIKQNYIAALGGIAVALMIAIIPKLIDTMISAGI